MSLLSTTDNDVEDEDDVGEILDDDDDRTWVNDMMDDGESNATTDYLMEEQCRGEDILLVIHTNTLKKKMSKTTTQLQCMIWII